MRVFAVALGLWSLAACTAGSSRAVVQLSPAAATPHLSAVLALPTVCTTLGLDASRCVPASYIGNAAGRPMPATFAAFIDPLLRIKLELSGLTLADAETLRLETAERSERTTTNDRGRVAETNKIVELSEVPTLLALPPEERRAAASSLGLQGIVSTTLQVTMASSGRLGFELTLELRSLTNGDAWLRVGCAEPFESPRETATILANCVGDGVLAALAPDALIGRQL